MLFWRSDFDREGRTLRGLLAFAYTVVPAMTWNSTPSPTPSVSHQAKSTDPGQRAGLNAVLESMTITQEGSLSGTFLWVPDYRSQFGPAHLQTAWWRRSLVLSP